MQDAKTILTYMHLSENLSASRKNVHWHIHRSSYSVKRKVWSDPIEPPENMSRHLLSIKKSWALLNNFRDEFHKSEDFLVVGTLHAILHKSGVSIKNFFSKYDQIRRKLRIWSYLLNKSLGENSTFFVQCNKGKVITGQNNSFFQQWVISY